MARLTSPESVKRKLDGIHGKIDELFETVGIIRELKDKIAESQDRLSGEEDAFRQRMNELDSLKNEYEAGITDLSQKVRASGKEMDEILSRFDAEKNRIDEILLKLGRERSDIDGIREKLDTEITRIQKKIDEKTAYFEHLAETSLENARSIIGQAIVEGKDRIASGIQREKEKTDDFREATLQEIQAGARELETRFETFQGEMENAIHEKFGKTEKAFEAESERKFAEFQDVLIAIEEKIDQRIAILKQEQTEIGEARNKLLEQSEAANLEFGSRTEAFSSRMEELIDRTRKRIDKSVEDGNHLIDEQVLHLKGIIQGSESDFRELKADLDGFRRRIDETIGKESENLFKELTMFRESTSDEISGMFTEEKRRLHGAIKRELKHVLSEFNQERIKIAEFLQSLKTEKKDIIALGNHVEDEFRKAENRITEKTNQFSEQFKKLIGNAQKKIINDSEQAWGEIEEKLKEFSGAIETFGARIEQFREAEQDFRNQAENELKTGLSDIRKRQETIEASAVRKIKETIREQADGLTETVMAKTGEFLLSREKEITKKILPLADGVDTLKKDTETLRAGLSELENGQEKIDTDVSELGKEVKQVLEKADPLESRTKAVEEQCRVLLDEIGGVNADRKKMTEFEKRIAELEARIEEMTRKKGLFSSFSKS